VSAVTGVDSAGRGGGGWGVLARPPNPILSRFALILFKLHEIWFKLVLRRIILKFFWPPGVVF